VIVIAALANNVLRGLSLRERATPYTIGQYCRMCLSRAAGGRVYLIPVQLLVFL